MGLDTDIVANLVEEIAGKDVVELVELIKGKDHVSEFKIADKLKLTVNQVRNMLYRLYSHNLVSFIRKKDKKKGWYIYYWAFDQKKGYNLFLKLKKEKLNSLKERLENETEGSYFACPNECVRLNFENSMEYDFKCPDCGTVLEKEDNTRRVSTIEREIKEINEQLERPYVEDKPKRKTRRKTAKKKATKKKSVKKKPVKRKTIKKKPKKKTTKKAPKKRSRKSK
jgi:transcription initiation factor TFIIE subunit alpha